MVACADVPFLERLGSELTRPVLPRSAAIDYLPSQYLCEFIKKIGYDGVIYRSSVSDGINCRTFSPARAVANDVELYDVQRVSVVVGLDVELLYGLMHPPPLRLTKHSRNTGSDFVTHN